MVDEKDELYDKIDMETGEVIEEDDFGFYGSESEEEEIRDIKGVTDEVSPFVFSDMEFPCICLKDNIMLPNHKWTIISKLVKQGSSDKNISVYVIRSGDLFKVGALSGTQIKAFIDIIGMNNMFGYHNKDTKLINDKLYVLSSVY